MTLLNSRILVHILHLMDIWCGNRNIVFRSRSSLAMMGKLSILAIKWINRAWVTFLQGGKIRFHILKLPSWLRGIARASSLVRGRHGQRSLEMFLPVWESKAR